MLDYLQRAGFAQAAAALELEAAALINSFVGPIGEVKLFVIFISAND